ncbi:hypothetical protein U0070_000154 [Myodes glareolus]|uniref:G-protein coupled receptors family 1 profile domain-containing protein n=1 Tax=Myodes glareolus TaxID=447135 RepID=A0AAW0J350_MYOGA
MKRKASENHKIARLAISRTRIKSTDGTSGGRVTMQQAAGRAGRTRGLHIPRPRALDKPLAQPRVVPLERKPLKNKLSIKVSFSAPVGKPYFEAWCRKENKVETDLTKDRGDDWKPMHTSKGERKRQSEQASRRNPVNTNAGERDILCTKGKNSYGAGDSLWEGANSKLLCRSMPGVAQISIVECCCETVKARAAAPICDHEKRRVDIKESSRNQGSVRRVMDCLIETKGNGLRNGGVMAAVGGRGLFDDSFNHLCLFLLIMLVFLTAVSGNSLTILLICADPRLHTPMYFLLSQLSLMDLMHISTTIPKTTSNYLSGKKSISFVSCATQHFVYLSLGGAECVLLALMSYDCHVAICHPLCYTVLMSRRVKPFVYCCYKVSKLSAPGHRDILESHSSVWAMAPLSQISNHINSTCGAENSTGVSRARPHAYYALSYCALILAIIFGNALVCAAVLRERALQTTTNYLVVSLAVADLLVATLVMPWVVYLEVATQFFYYGRAAAKASSIMSVTKPKKDGDDGEKQLSLNYLPKVTGGVWNFSRICCDVFVTLDVMMCTASILNLCAISIDSPVPQVPGIVQAIFNNPGCTWEEVSEKTPQISAGCRVELTTDEMKRIRVLERVWNSPSLLSQLRTL